MATDARRSPKTIATVNFKRVGKTTPPGASPILAFVHNTGVLMFDAGAQMPLTGTALNETTGKLDDKFRKFLRWMPFSGGLKATRRPTAKICRVVLSARRFGLMDRAGQFPRLGGLHPALWRFYEPSEAYEARRAIWPACPDLWLESNGIEGRTASH